MGIKGFFTDTTVCIGCKACEVGLQAVEPAARRRLLFTGMSYDNTVELGASTWRHVAFVERAGAAVRTRTTGVRSFSWLLASDVCKHCQRAGCLEACPTGAIVRTEFDSVYVQPDVCNGCGYCVVACPFGVIDRRAGRRPRLEMHPLLRPAEGRPGAGLRQGLPHRLDPVRRPGASCRRRRGQRWRSCTTQGVSEAYLYGIDGSGPARHRGAATPSSCWWTSRRSTTCRPTRWCRPKKSGRPGAP